jgi:hypothetical protein
MTRSAEAQPLSLGVLAHSRKPDERRLPIHPAHFIRIDQRVRQQIFLEHGYGAEFGATDDELAALVGGIGSREQLIAECDIILLPKVQPRTYRNSMWDRSSGVGHTACRTPR